MFAKIFDSLCLCWDWGGPDGTHSSSYIQEKLNQKSGYGLDLGYSISQSFQYDQEVMEAFSFFIFLDESSG